MNRLIAALAMVIAAQFVLSGQARAGGLHDPAPMVSAAHADGAAHLENGHPGHCHGGSLCGASAVVAAGPSAARPDRSPSRHVAMLPLLRALDTPTHDPPPPRARL